MQNKFIAPIWIHSEVEDINLTESIYLRKISTKELAMVFNVEEAVFDKNQRLKSTMSPLENHLEPRFLNRYDNLTLAGSSDGKRDTPIKLFRSAYFILESENKNDIRAFITSLRILKKGLFYCPLAFYEDTTKTPTEVAPYPLENLATDATKAFNFKIKKSEIETINKIFKKVLEREDDIHIERFRENQNVSRSDNIRFIEAISIIEAIIVDQDSELSFRFALYLSFLLDHITYKEAKKLYKIRSNLIHSGKSKDYVNLDQIALNETALDASREILKKYLFDNITANQILEDINCKLDDKEKK